MLRISNRIAIGAKAKLSTLLNLAPVILKDGNTVAWYDQMSVIADGLGKVSRWNDKLGSGHDLIQLTAAAQPTLVDNEGSPITSVQKDSGILFDGLVDGNGDKLKTDPFTFNQPEMLYMVLNQVTWHSSGAVIDGNSTYSGLIHQIANDGYLRAYAGAYSPSAPLLDNGELYGITGINVIIKLLFNGSSSKIKIGGSEPVTGNFGTSNMGGITLGANGGGAERANIIFKEVIARKIADNTTDEAAIYKYLKAKYKTKTFGFYGDSTLSHYPGASATAVSLLMNKDFLNDDESYPGATIALMKTALIENTSDDLDCVFVMLGLNDVNIHSSAVSIADYQDFINTIRTKIGSTKKIIITTMIPCNRSSFQAWTDLNEAILGNGATPIAGVDGRVNTVDTALNDGSNGLAAMYDSGDHLHENNLGRRIIADLFDAKRTELGL